MGNTTSTGTNLERFHVTTEFITHPSLQHRLRNINEKVLLHHLGKFAIETPYIDTYWISLMQKQGVIDWSDISSAVDICLDSMLRYDMSVGYVEALLYHIIKDAQKGRDQRAQEGVIAMIDLACGVDWIRDCWKRNDPIHPRGSQQLHRLVAEAIDSLDHSFDLRSGHNDQYSRGHLLYYGAFGIYKRLRSFLLEGCEWNESDGEEDHADDGGIGLWNSGWVKHLVSQLDLDFDSD
jgi:hypothetical protein